MGVAGDYQLVIVMVAIAASFLTSASVGLGGSLILVPTLALTLGTKEGVALAALLLGANNIVKVIAYRRSLPIRSASGLLVLVMVGAAVGATLLVAAPEQLVTTGVITALVTTLLVERFAEERLRRVGAPILAAGAGITSGFSGTSGPLKGVAVRSLQLDRAHLVGGASLLSLVGDLTKAGIFAHSSLLGAESLRLLALAVPVMFVATFAGRHLNQTVGERGYRAMFWTVMGGYTVRLLVI